MTHTSARLAEIFLVVLGLPSGFDVTLVSPDTVGTWDSLAHVSLVAAIESEFGVTIDPDEALEMTSFADTAEMLCRRLT